MNASSAKMVSVRLPAESRRIAKRHAADRGLTLAAWLSAAVGEKARRDSRAVVTESWPDYETFLNEPAGVPETADELDKL